MAKRSGESNCRHPKHKPYGATGTSPYCRAHDCHSPYKVSKSRVRQKVKRQIEKEEEERIKHLAEQEAFRRKLSF